MIGVVQLRNDLKLWVTNNLRTKLDKNLGNGESGKFLVVDASGDVDTVSIGASINELGYMSGVTSNVQEQLNGKAPSSHGTHVTYSTTAPVIAGTASVGDDSTVARGDHVHPAQTTVSGNAGSATKLATTRYIDGLSFNGEVDVSRYAVCSTAADTQEKVATISAGTFSLTTGARVTVKFENANSVASPALNIGGAGAKSIYWDGAALPQGQFWKAGAMLDFVYDGEAWELRGEANFVGKNVAGTVYNFDLDGDGVAEDVTAAEGAEVFNHYSTNKATGKYSHAEGAYTRATGEYSHAEGNGSYATKSCSHAEGFETKATGSRSHSEGNGTIASGNSSHAEGTSTEASGTYSHAEGVGAIASGSYSHAEGNYTKALGDFSHAEGNETTALLGQHSQGHYNSTANATAGCSDGTGSGTAFVIGNGVLGAGSNAFRVDYNGTPYSKSALTTTGADYAEYFEWLDLNPNDEDRRGYFVTLDGDKIKLAEPNDYILGIVSGQPSVIGNGDEDWMGRYVFDEFGAFVYEDFEYEVEIFEDVVDEETGEIVTEKKVITKTGTRYRENPDYDPSMVYIQRGDRPEWDAVGMLGVLSVRDDGTCKVNGYCKVADGGIATASEAGYRVIKRMNDNIVKVVFR